MDLHHHTQTCFSWWSSSSLEGEGRSPNIISPLQKFISLDTLPFQVQESAIGRPPASCHSFSTQQKAYRPWPLSVYYKSHVVSYSVYRDSERETELTKWMFKCQSTHAISSIMSPGNSRDPTTFDRVCVTHKFVHKTKHSPSLNPTFPMFLTLTTRSEVVGSLPLMGSDNIAHKVGLEIDDVTWRKFVTGVD